MGKFILGFILGISTGFYFGYEKSKDYCINNSNAINSNFVYKADNKLKKDFKINDFYENNVLCLDKFIDDFKREKISYKKNNITYFKNYKI